MLKQLGLNMRVGCDGGEHMMFRVTSWGLCVSASFLEKVPRAFDLVADGSNSMATCAKSSLWNGEVIGKRSLQLLKEILDVLLQLRSIFWVHVVQKSS